VFAGGVAKSRKTRTAIQAMFCISEAAGREYADFAVAKSEQKNLKRSSELVLMHPYHNEIIRPMQNPVEKLQ
jgi:hypothetical protein